MSTVKFAAVSLLLAAFSICSIAKSSKSPALPWTWPGMPPLPPWGWPGMPPLPPYGGMPPYPPGGWPPGQGGGGGCSCSCTCNTLPTRAPKEFVVGDDKEWSFGTNYTEWALSNGPFYVGDTLEFKYPQPVPKRSSSHSVHLLKDLKSFENCNLAGSKRIGDEYAGEGPDGGFKLTLDKKPSGDPFIYYIACGEKNGFHCKVGTMKFVVVPLLSG